MPMRPESSVCMKLMNPIALLAEQVFVGHFDVLEDELARVRRAPAELVLLLSRRGIPHIREANRRARSSAIAAMSRSRVPWSG